MAVKFWVFNEKTLADLLAGVTPSITCDCWYLVNFQVFSNKWHLRTMKVKFNIGEYSRGEVICKANTACLNMKLTLESGGSNYVVHEFTPT